MLNQFSRTELVFGREAINRLRACRVAVFGIGGVGGYAAEALVRSGIGTLDIIDGDKVCASNLNRQIFATLSTVGQYKVDAARERLHDICANTEINAHKCFYAQDTAGQFDLTQYDYIIDAIDTVKSKLELIVQAADAGTPVISSMGAGNKLDASALRVADIYDTKVCPLARVMRHELRKRHIECLKVVYSEETPMTFGNKLMPDCAEAPNVPGSTAFVPAAAGLILAGETVRDLIRAF